METPTSLKKDWVLTQEALGVLLARLDPDEEQAGQKYEDIRHGLITFFECRGCGTPEDLADETIDRVARRLLEGGEIYARNAVSYFYGVARNVLKEHWDSPGRASASLESVPAVKLASDDPGRLHQRSAEGDLGEQQLQCLEQCLQALAARDRELIAAYYQGETSEKIRNRKSLATKLGIPLNALRIRALRIRERLEACVERCLSQSRNG